MCKWHNEHHRKHNALHTCENAHHTIFLCREKPWQGGITPENKINKGRSECNVITLGHFPFTLYPKLQPGARTS